VVVVDVETTGRSKTARMTQLAARTANGSSTFNQLIRPPQGAVWEAGAVRVNGINAHTVKDAPMFDQAIVKFLSWLERLNCDHVLLVAHNATFDRLRFDFEFSLLPDGRSASPSNWHWADSLALARALRGTGSNSLEALCKHFNVVNRKAHDALADVNALWDIIKRLLFPAAKSSADVSDADAEARFIDIYAFSATFKAFPPALKELRSNGAPSAKKKRTCCPSCGAADHFARSSAKCAKNPKHAAAPPAAQPTLPVVLAAAAAAAAPAPITAKRLQDLVASTSGSTAESSSAPTAKRPRIPNVRLQEMC